MITTIIHPPDITTLYLNKIYDNIKLKQSGKNAILMFGHGNPNGLFNLKWDGYEISNKDISYIKEHEIVVGIWCNANTFAEINKLTGLFSGMVISEVIEANAYNYEISEEDMLKLNDIYAEDMRYCLENYNLKDIPKEFSKMNRFPENDITNFNYNSLYFIEKGIRL